jgi:hypothetical protein
MDVLGVRFRLMMMMMLSRVPAKSQNGYQVDFEDGSERIGKTADMISGPDSHFGPVWIDAR